MKKILFLGGKPIGSSEIVIRLKELGYYVIVTDFLTPEQSPAKLIANEHWDISTGDVDLLSEKARAAGVEGVVTGVHEFNINRMLDICERLDLPVYCTRDTWRYCDNKREFKNMCLNSGIPVAKTYDRDIFDRNSGLYPVIVKPVDGSGSRGFHICHDHDDLAVHYERAKTFSPTGSVLIEDYIPYDAVIIHYTMIDGKCFYSGISDKISVKFPSTGASVMGIQTFPSKGESVYLESLDRKVRRMFEDAGFKNGPIWIEAFYDGSDRFVFNEMGYRFGGSLTYYPVKYFTGIDQLDLLIDSSVSGKDVSKPDIRKPVETSKNYCILPIHIKPGTITDIVGSDNLLSKEDIYAVVPVHFVGDVIEEWGSAQQVYAYLHILYKDKDDLTASIKSAFETLKVLDENGDNMIHTIIDVDSLKL